MGMPISLEVVGEAEDAVERVFEYLREVDETFSTFKPGSVISRINRGELQPAAAPAEVRQVLADCEVMRRRTDGYFDIRRGKGIDPSGLVKGWSIGEAAKLLALEGAHNFCLEAGGDIVVRGMNPDGKEWHVGIRNPRQRDEIVKVLKLTGMAVATSGTYERGEHIYDPHTGKAATTWLSLTVVGPDIVTADVFATAACAMGPGGPVWVAKQGLECYTIGHDERAVFTPGLERFLLTAAP
jgi:thiamine biosynthesis lipoprotein